MGTDMGESYGRCWQDAAMSETGGRLILACAPIGNVADASSRLAAALAGADVVAVEDTRRVRRLAGALGVQLSGRLLSYYDANEAARTVELVEGLLGGAQVLLLTDAGTPSISDPGYRLVSAAVANGVAVTVLPGPSAVTTAVAISGLPCDRWCFEGFLPRRGAERRRALAALASEPRTLVFFEAPHRVSAALVDLADAFGPDRPAALCRELTKTHEEVRRGGLRALADWAADGVRGEVTLVVAGAPPAAPVEDPAGWARAVAAREAAGTARKAAIAEVARGYGVPKRAVFDAVVAARAAETTMPAP
jgi:16S rRNA (cytidine1402-2'-O)-methyltransferase